VLLVEPHPKLLELLIQVVVAVVMVIQVRWSGTSAAGGSGVVILSFPTAAGTITIRTSYNNNIRKQYAGIGYTYDAVNDVFIAPQPYPSWALDNDF
jgi:hypothetical protein